MIIGIVNLSGGMVGVLFGTWDPRVVSIDKQLNIVNP